MNQQAFMGWLTLILLASVQAASVWLLVSGGITGETYLSAWVPLMTLAVGYWFGQQRTAP